MKFSKRDIGRAKSNNWLKDNWIMLVVIFLAVKLLPSLSGLLDSVFDPEKLDRQQLESGISAMKIDSSKLQLSNSEIKNIANKIWENVAHWETNVLGDSAYYLSLGFYDSGSDSPESNGIEVDDTIYLLMMNKSDWRGSYVRHFLPNGTPTAYDPLNMSNWSGTTQYEKPYIPYNKDTLKAIFKEFGVRYYSEFNWGESGGIITDGADVLFGSNYMDMSGWHKKQVGSNHSSYKALQTIFKGAVAW